MKVGMRGMRRKRGKRNTALLVLVMVLAMFLMAQCAPLSEQIVPSAVGTVTPIPLPTEVPLLPTALPSDLTRSSELTSNIVLMGVLMVTVIVAGTFYGIRRRRS